MLPEDALRLCNEVLRVSSLPSFGTTVAQLETLQPSDPKALSIIEECNRHASEVICAMEGPPQVVMGYLCRTITALDRILDSGDALSRDQRSRIESIQQKMSGRAELKEKLMGHHARFAFLLQRFDALEG
ncbi:MAG TPA: hypothetical protein VI873_01215 [Candidatus Peribacteraceae bacterium]|nr:hypothetical protein [Candidatus Peribacteraceae bacterium]